MLLLPMIVIVMIVAIFIDRRFIRKNKPDAPRESIKPID